jgi:hypothetical protein
MKKRRKGKPELKMKENKKEFIYNKCIQELPLVRRTTEEIWRRGDARERRLRYGESSKMIDKRTEKVRCKL